jgi:hypothetical protein
MRPSYIRYSAFSKPGIARDPCDPRIRAIPLTKPRLFPILYQHYIELTGAVPKLCFLDRFLLLEEIARAADARLTKNRRFSPGAWPEA